MPYCLRTPMGAVLRVCFRRVFNTSAVRKGAKPHPGLPAGTSAIIMATIPPQPNASAAGVRTSYIMKKLETSGTRVHFVAPQPESEGCASSTYHQLPLNDSKRASEIIDPITKASDQQVLVIFDRFYAEEMHSFRFFETTSSISKAMLVLDMQDFHALRNARKERDENALPDSLDSALRRELASIHRCDLTLVCSSYELELLHTRYGIPRGKLCLAPLFGDMPDTTASRAMPFEDRHDFVFIGGFLHKPNVDAVRKLKNTLWPMIRAELNNPASLHIYGAFCPSELQVELHDPQAGFLMHGFHPSVETALEDKRVMLSPLRFGAGIKGKHVDAWKAGLPVVTTSIGSEGMEGPNGEFGGIVATSDAEFVRAALCLHEDKKEWEKRVANIFQLLLPLCGQWDHVESRLAHVMSELDQRRKSD